MCTLLRCIPPTKRYPILSYPFLVRSHGAPPAPIPSSSPSATTSFRAVARRPPPPCLPKVLRCLSSRARALIVIYNRCPVARRANTGRLNESCSDGFRRVRGGISRSTVFGRPNSLADSPPWFCLAKMASGRLDFFSVWCVNRFVRFFFSPKKGDSDSR